MHEPRPGELAAQHEQENTSTDESGIYYIGFLLAAAVIWGCTNPFIRKGSIEEKKHIPVSDSRTTGQKRPLLSLRRISSKAIRFVKNWQVSVPFVINQCGSLFFWAGLAHAPLQFAVPFTNALTFLFTTLTGAFLGESISPKHVFGMVLVLLGVYFCSKNP